ncbi:hypothetical protein CALVIDRAFT_485973 [Calocera viscosa TUFC12733]|uniref:UbiA prenyltransferase n=1 Tax=Calocera viscosa (strain TUFC12733) TaxID=1330018 RepID=A0A167J7X5_CALVF|nr:hypothetical protein CALVIDRAFT_485973 [Calocera viscosa TUFC12733]
MRRPKSIHIPIQWLSDGLYTLYLFTKADYHTLFFPILIFACVAGPVRSPYHFFAAVAWTWLHLLQCNISNQYRSITEDAGNKPWRPLPAGRITPDQASKLHAVVTLLCLLASAPSGWEMVLVSITLTVTTILYDNLRMSAHWAKRVVCVVTGYGIFEYGATKVIAGSVPLDNIAWAAIASSLIVIATTAHVGDFPDVEGDKQDGRWTIPIAFPKSSRVITPVLIMFWSIAMAVQWELGLFNAVSLVLMGALVAYRNLALREWSSDKRTYVLHSIWLLTIHLLPMNARWNSLCY